MSTVSGRSGAFELDRPRACIRPVRDPGSNTTRPLPSGAPVGRMGRCEKEPAVILVSDQGQGDLGGPELTCPHCPGELRRWGFARTRSLRSSGGGRVWLRPRRVRCTSCRVTHVLLPALAPPHRAYTIDLVGQALLASAGGQSHRAIGADLGVPPDTVRDWIRRVRAHAEWLRVQGTIEAHMLDPEIPRSAPHPSPPRPPPRPPPAPRGPPPGGLPAG